MDTKCSCTLTKLTCAACMAAAVVAAAIEKREQIHTHVEAPQPVAAAPGVVASSSSTSAIARSGLTLQHGVIYLTSPSIRS